MNNKTAIIFGASSLIAKFLAIQLSDRGYKLCLIGRDRNKIMKLVRLLNPNASKMTSIFYSDLGNYAGIEKAIAWVKKNEISPALVFICPGIVFYDKSNASAHEYIEASYVNSLLPLFIYRDLNVPNKRNNLKLITLSSLFVEAPKTGKLFYSYSKKLFSVFFKNNFRGPIHSNYLFKLGPVDTPMYHGTKFPYVSSPEDISKKIIFIVENKNGGIYYLPKYWFLTLPLLKIFNFF